MKVSDKIKQIIEKAYKVAKMDKTRSGIYFSLDIYPLSDGFQCSIREYNGALEEKYFAGYISEAATLATALNYLEQDLDYYESPEPEEKIKVNGHTYKLVK